MNIKYKNYIDYINEIKALYYKSFPKKERFLFWILKHSVKQDKSSLNAIVDDNKFIGMNYIEYIHGMIFII